MPIRKHRYTSSKLVGFRLLVVLLLFAPRVARPDFWSLSGKGEMETVKLSRRLPPIAVRTGDTVRFEPEIAGSIPPEIATMLREKIRTLLLNARAGGIQLVDGPADTVIKCILTGYEPKTVVSNQRKVGLKIQQLATWIGNIEASVQVLDSRGRPVESASGNLKFHLEEDYVLTEKEEEVKSVGDKKTSWRDKLVQGLNISHGGDAGDVAGALGSGKAIHDSLSKDTKGPREPTELEWRDLLIEGLADKVANRIVTVDQEFVAILPVDKEFAQMRELAKANHWGDVEEQAEKMGTQKDSKEAYRLYLVGLSNEAIAYGEADKTGEAADLLNKASKDYADALNLQPKERALFLAGIRVQDSLDHYLEIQHLMETRKAAPVSKAPAEVVADAKTKEDATDNAALISMVGAKLPVSVLLNFVQTAPNPVFDTSAKGLVQLAKANVPPSVIQAVQKRMMPKPASRASAMKGDSPTAQQ